MKYFEEKDWKYHVKSAVATFLAVFLPLFLMQLSAYNLDGLKPEDITSDSAMAAAIALFRVFLVAGAQAVIVMAKKKS